MNVKAAIAIALALNLMTVIAGPSVLASAVGGRSATGSQVLATNQLGQTGQSQTVQGVTVTLQQLRGRPEPAKGNPREASQLRTGGISANPNLSPTASPAAQVSSGQNLPQTLVDEIVGPQITDTPGFVPPDTMGAVGPTQFLFSVNGRFRGFNKNLPHTQILNLAQSAFWGSTADSAGVSDGHVRYDRASQRWFITEIDVPTGNNHILLAVSSGPDLSTASWRQFAIPATGGAVATDNGCFADYDTPGIDQNGIYIGENMFGGVAPCIPANYKHSNLYVIQKSSALTSTLHFTPFYNVVTGLFGIETIQGVDSADSLDTGYAVAVKETESPRQHVSLWQINNPGTISPTLSGPTDVAINAENGASGGVVSKNNALSANPTRAMADVDDRLFSAVIRAGHLWTAHNVKVDSTGNSNGGSLTRDAVRWLDITVSGPTLNQSGTVFDSASSGFLEYWMGTIMVSGQGHVAIGLNRANTATVVQAGAIGRLAGDAPGTMGGFSPFQSSTADAYDDASFVTAPANRWGDYTYTSLDPCDDMTMWTTQEYVAGPTAFGLPIDWGVAAEKLQAPPPAAPTLASPNTIPSGQSNVSVTITGTSTSGSGFYDTPSTLTDPCRKRMTASVSGGVTVNSVTYTDPTHITLNLSTVGATGGPQNLTVANPDGQVVVANNLITVGATLSASPGPVSPGGTVTATWSGLTSPGAGDWIGIYIPGAADSAYLGWRSTTGMASGSVAFSIPSLSPGNYELRLFSNYMRQATSGLISVQVATLSASPGPVNPGGTVTATWSGIGSPSAGDWIGLYSPGAADSAYLGWRSTTGMASGSVAFTIPASLSPGTYELRLYSNYMRQATSGLISVQVATLSASPSPVNPGGTVTATWSGLGSPGAGDWIGIYIPGAADSAYLGWRSTTGMASGSVAFIIPASLSPGNYELRLFSNYMRQATSGLISVQVATLSASPGPVNPGGTVTATWSGLGSPGAGDWIGIYIPGAADSAYLGWRSTTGMASGSVAFTIPASLSPGNYELRLFSNYTRQATSGLISVQ